MLWKSCENCLNRVINAYVSPFDFDTKVTRQVHLSKQFQEMYIHTNRILLCVSPMNTSWSFNEGPLKSNMRVEVLHENSSLIVNRLIISKTEYWNDGRYECIHDISGDVITGDYVYVKMFRSPGSILKGRTKLSHCSLGLTM